MIGSTTQISISAVERRSSLPRDQNAPTMAFPFTKKGVLSGQFDRQRLQKHLGTLCISGRRRTIVLGRTLVVKIARKSRSRTPATSGRRGMPRVVPSDSIHWTVHELERLLVGAPEPGRVGTSGEQPTNRLLAAKKSGLHQRATFQAPAWRDSARRQRRGPTSRTVPRWAGTRRQPTPPSTYLQQRSRP